MTWLCAQCGWGYPPEVRSEAAWHGGEVRSFCCLCIPINPARLSRLAALDFEQGQLQARTARDDGRATPPSEPAA